jgi:type I restriction enzyme S subunit
VAGVSLCTNQGCKSFIAGPEIDPWFLYYMLRFRMAEIRALGSGATFAEVSKSDLETFEIEFPSVQEQTRIAKRLTHQVEIASGAAAMAVSRLQTARSLGLQILIGAFRHTSGQWPTRRLRDLVESRRSPSVNADGDTAVTTVTSGCLTPFGFALEGLRTGRMHSRDAVDGAVSRDEVLVSRSNTEALVGRASRYPGGTRTVVASDLVFRLVPEGAALDPEYLAGRLSVLQLDGYWRDRSSGASSTMKKITKALLFDVELALPPIAEQLRIVHMFQERMRSIKSLEAAIRSERTAIDALPAALLRRALGELAV